jgi:hypothetical protein
VCKPQHHKTTLKPENQECLCIICDFTSWPYKNTNCLMVTKSPPTCRKYSTSSSLNIGTLNLASLIQNCNSKAILFFGRGNQKITTTSLVRDNYRFYPVTCNFCPSTHTTQAYSSAKPRLQDYLTYFFEYGEHNMLYSISVHKMIYFKSLS